MQGSNNNFAAGQGPMIYHIANPTDARDRNSSTNGARHGRTRHGSRPAGDVVTPGGDGPRPRVGGRRVAGGVPRGGDARRLHRIAAAADAIAAAAAAAAAEQCRHIREIHAPCRSAKQLRSSLRQESCGGYEPYERSRESFRLDDERIRKRMLRQERGGETNSVVEKSKCRRRGETSYTHAASRRLRPARPVPSSYSPSGCWQGSV